MHLTISSLVLQLAQENIPDISKRNSPNSRFLRSTQIIVVYVILNACL